MKLHSIQMLRALAANMVVVSHLSVIEAKYGHGFIILPQDTDLGRFGVHLFFVISGFVIAMVASERPSLSRFLWARVVRIYPIYWFYTAIVLAVAAVAPAMVNSSYDVTPVLWRSILLFPDKALPWLAVGWSLIHEMYFYIVVALILFLRINFYLALALWSAILLLPLPTDTPVLSVVLSRYTFEFIFGCCLWWMFSRFGLAEPKWRCRLIEALGDASYSIYLSHVLVLSALGRLFAAQPWHSWPAEAVFLMIAFALANLCGFVSYRVIELPLMRLARTRHRAAHLPQS